MPLPRSHRNHRSTTLRAPSPSSWAVLVPFLTLSQVLDLTSEITTGIFCNWYLLSQNVALPTMIPSSINALGSKVILVPCTSSRQCWPRNRATVAVVQRAYVIVIQVSSTTNTSTIMEFEHPKRRLTEDRYASSTKLYERDDGQVMFYSQSLQYCHD
jgi:hypothetical protein